MLVSSRPREEITAWYIGQSTVDISIDAYRKAVEYFEKELADRPSERAWIRGQTSLEDARSTVEAASNAYDDRSEHQAAAKRWLEAFASTIGTYGAVFDVLSAADPVHAGLAWGAIRFIFAGVTNYCQHAAELAKALSHIGEALPRIRIEMALYNTSHMSDAIARLYAHILLFLQRAVTWYNTNRARRIMKTILRPSQLAFKDTVMEIEVCTRNVEMIANTAGRAEIRGQSHLLRDQAGRQQIADQRLSDMQDQVDQLQVSSIRQSQMLQQTMQYVINSHDMLNNIRLGSGGAGHSSMASSPYLAQIHQMLKSGPSSEDMLKICQSFSRRRASWLQNDRNTTIVLKQLGKWAQMPGSSLVIAKPGPRAMQRTLDMATEVVALLRTTSIPVFYYLSTSTQGGKTPTIDDVVKSLISQALSHNPSVLSQEPHLWNLSALEASHSPTEWSDLAIRVLSEVGQCFVVVALEGRDQRRGATTPTGMPGQLVETLVGIYEQVSSKGAVVKVLMVADSGSLSSSSLANGPAHTLITMSGPVPISRRLQLSSRTPNLGLGRGRLAGR